jgi:hypothetical protein
MYLLREDKIRKQCSVIFEKVGNKRQDGSSINNLLVNVIKSGFKIAGNNDEIMSQY